MAKSVLINLLSAAAFLCLTGTAASRDLSDCDNGKAASAVTGTMAEAEHDCADTAEVRPGKAQAPLAKLMIKPKDIQPGAEDAPSAAPNAGTLMRAKDFVVLVKRPEMRMAKRWCCCTAPAATRPRLCRSPRGSPRARS
jgi:ubiquitin